LTRNVAVTKFWTAQNLEKKKRFTLELKKHDQPLLGTVCFPRTELAQQNTIERGDPVDQSNSRGKAGDDWQ